MLALRRTGQRHCSTCHHADERGDGKNDPNRAKWQAVLPLEPKNEPDSVAAVVVALCGSVGRNINGQIIGAGNGLIRILTGPAVKAEFLTPEIWNVTEAEAVLGVVRIGNPMALHWARQLRCSKTWARASISWQANSRMSEIQD